MLYTYSIVIFFYGIFIRIASLFSPKAKQWVVGRKNWKYNLQKHTPSEGFDLWMHCSSLGEFEQGRPVLEAFRKLHPSATILLSFFSPSGYEIRKNYKVVNYVSYLPLDTSNNAKDWMNIAQPKQTIFVKYDFWFNFLAAIKSNSTHAILISALFHKSHFFNSWLGEKFQYSLSAFEAIFFQKPQEFQTNNSIFTKVVGDTRVDRVLQIQKEKANDQSLSSWVNGKNVMVWGSVWESDFTILNIGLNDALKNWKHIIAPHEPNKKNINSIQKISGSNFQKLSDPININSEIIIVDSIGQLSGLYKFGSAAYIGGGFGNGIHNTLEPMAANCPVIIGPKYHKFPEAVEGIECKAVFSVNDENDFLKLSELFNQSRLLKSAQMACSEFINSKAGATQEIIQYLESIG